MKKNILVKLSLLIFIGLGTTLNASSYSVEENTNDIRIIKKALSKLIKEQNKLIEEKNKLIENQNKLIENQEKIKKKQINLKNKSLSSCNSKSSRAGNKFRLVLDRNLYKKATFKSRKMKLLKKGTIFHSNDTIEDKWMYNEEEKGYIYIGNKHKRSKK